MGRRPQLVSKVPFKVLKPMQLTEVVSGGPKNRLTGICFNEISALFLCLKNSGFNEEACPKEVDNFQKCYYLHFNRKFSQDSAISKKKETPEVINMLLKKYPDIKER